MVHTCGARVFGLPCVGAWSADEVSTEPAYAARHRLALAGATLD